LRNKIFKKSDLMSIKGIEMNVSKSYRFPNLGNQLMLKVFFNKMKYIKNIRRQENE